MNKHNIAILLNHPYFVNRGGALITWTHEVYRRLVNHWDVDVYAHDFGSEVVAYNQFKASPQRFAQTIHKLIRKREFKGLLTPLKRRLRTAKYRKAGRTIAKSCCGLIHIHNDPESVQWVRKYNSDAVIVLHMQNDHLIEAESVVANQAIHDSDYMAFCSEYLMNGALRKYPILKKENCFVIRNGSLQHSTTDNGTKANSTAPLLLFVGRIVPNKGVHVLIEAFSLVIKEFPEVRLRIVGGIDFGVDEIDDYARKLRDMAVPYGAQVEFTGPVNHSETYGHYQEASVFVCPSIWEEALGMVNAEAMAFGLPVVAFAKGGIPEVVGDAGIIVREITPRALAKGICAVLKDSALATELGRRGLNRVSSEYNWDVIASQWSGKITKMLKSESLN